MAMIFMMVTPWIPGIGEGNCNQGEKSAELSHIGSGGVDLEKYEFANCREA
jgi:hypothetical protein